MRFLIGVVLSAACELALCSTPNADGVMLSGTPPASVAVGQTYSFTPKVTNPQHRWLWFRIYDKPAWMQFNSYTGTLSGKPTAMDIGTSPANILIQAWDGRYGANLIPEFSVTVTPAAVLGSATLTLEAPTHNTDGSVLTDLTGLTIYYGASASNLDHSQFVPDQLATSAYVEAVIQNLAAGTWYFGAKADASDGQVSALSTVKSKTVQ